jgi:cystathionine beta-lyase/cystathionine gamma-synthase
MGLSTLGIHGGAEPGRPGDAVVPPLVQSATFLGGRQDDALLYSRYGNNPLQRQVARKIAALEGTEDALILGSGMAAVAMAVLALVREGDHLVASRHLYGATLDLFSAELPRRGVDVTFVDPVDAEAWTAAIRPRTRLLYLEAPTNPTLRMFDPALAAAAAASAPTPAGAPPIRVVMDATFATPINLRAADLGVDLVLHSATKYLGGHSDLIAGVVAGPSSLITEVTTMMKLYGPAADPHMVWLLDRGVRTLEVRMRRHNANALRIARYLTHRPEVAQVHYPGLESHPDHALATRLMPGGSGGMVSFVLVGGGEAADRFMDGLHTVQVAPSLGGVESLVSQPRFTSHRSMSSEERAAAGIPDGFVRLSVGIEDAVDLERDLASALDGLGR